MFRTTRTTPRTTRTTPRTTSRTTRTTNRITRTTLRVVLVVLGVVLVVLEVVLVVLGVVLRQCSEQMFGTDSVRNNVPSFRASRTGPGASGEVRDPPGHLQDDQEQLRDHFL